MARYQVQTSYGRPVPDLTAAAVDGVPRPAAQDDTLKGAVAKARAAANACLDARILVVDTQSAGAVVQELRPGQ